MFFGLQTFRPNKPEQRFGLEVRSGEKTPVTTEGNADQYRLLKKLKGDLDGLSGSRDFSLRNEFGFAAMQFIGYSPGGREPYKPYTPRREK